MFYAHCFFILLLLFLFVIVILYFLSAVCMVTWREREKDSIYRSIHEHIVKFRKRKKSEKGRKKTKLNIERKKGEKI